MHGSGPFTSMVELLLSILSLPHQFPDHASEDDEKDDIKDQVHPGENFDG
jgi:hypothetical protein